MMGRLKRFLIRYIVGFMVGVTGLLIVFGASRRALLMMISGILIIFFSAEIAFLLYSPIYYLKRREYSQVPDFGGCDEAEVWLLENGYQIVHECDSGGGHIVGKKASRVPLMTYTVEHMVPPDMEVFGLGDPSELPEEMKEGLTDQAPPEIAESIKDQLNDND